VNANRAVASLVAALVTATGVAGESADLAELSLEQLMQIPIENVVGASRYEQKVTRAPASVSIVTAEDIRQFGYRTLADVLRSVRGLYVPYDRNYSNLGMRGFSRPGDFNTRVLLLLDGRRMNDNLYSSALIGPEATLDLDLVERIEVIRGPSSSIYGSSAFFGVINVITRDAQRFEGVELSASAASLDSYKGRITYADRFAGGAELVLSASTFDSRGHERLYFPEFDVEGTNNGMVAGNDGESAQNLLASLAYKDFELSAAYSRRDKEIPTASFSTVFNDGREEATDERVLVDLKYAHAYGASHLTGRLSYDRYSYFADYPYNFAGPGDPPFVAVTHDDNYGDGVGAELQLTRKLFDQHTLVLGAEWRRDLNLSQSNFVDDPKTYSFQDNRDGRSVGVYAQGEVRIREDLFANVGVRFDDFSVFGGRTSPRMALIYSPTERAAIKLLYGTAYRAPNAYELYQASPGFSKGNRGLEPERIRTTELVYEQYLASALRFSASAYHYDVDDLISQIQDAADGLLVFRNFDQIHAEGLELELEDRYANGLVARLSSAVQRAEDRRSGDALNNSPKMLAKLNVAVPLSKQHLSAALEAQYSSGVGTLSGTRAAGFTVMNATVLAHSFANRLDASASIYNLLDRSYAYPGSTAHLQNVIPQDGRTFRIELTYRFEPGLSRPAE
jgi:iron complex outermembrane receptor protein